MYREMYPCPICEKVLSTIFELQSHLNSHQPRMERKDSDSESVRSDVQVRQPPPRPPPIQPVDLSDDSIDEDEVVHKIMENVFKEFPREELVDNDDQFVLKKMIPKIKDHVENSIDYAEQIQQTEFYNKISDEKLRLENQGQDEAEAETNAWSKRKYMIYEELIEPFLKDKPDPYVEDDGDGEGDVNGNEINENNDVTKDCLACRLHDVNPSYYKQCILHNE